MKKELLTEDIIHADETELRVLKRDGKPTKKMSRMWVFCSGMHSSKPMSLYKYHATRSAKVVEEMLGRYEGYLQTDGYAAYNSAINAIRAGCAGLMRDENGLTAYRKALKIKTQDQHRLFYWWKSFSP